MMNSIRIVRIELKLPLPGGSLGGGKRFSVSRALEDVVADAWGVIVALLDVRTRVPRGWVLLTARERESTGCLVPCDHE